METTNDIYAVKYADVVSTTANSLSLIFTMTNGDEVKFNIQATEPINLLKSEVGAITGNPETSIKQQGTRELVIIYDDTTDQDNHETAILALLPVGVTVTIDPSSISTLATLAEQQTQTGYLDNIFADTQDISGKLTIQDTNFANGNYKIRLNSTADTVTTDSNIRSAGSHQTGNFFSCQLTVLTGTMTIDGVTYPQTTASGGKIDSVTFEAPAGWQHFDFTYTVNAASTVLEIITKSL